MEVGMLVWKYEQSLLHAMGCFVLQCRFVSMKRVLHHFPATFVGHLDFQLPIEVPHGTWCSKKG